MPMLTGRPYPVRALFASGCKYAVTYPDTQRTVEAAEKLDLFVVAAHDDDGRPPHGQTSFFPRRQRSKRNRSTSIQGGPCVTTRAQAQRRTVTSNPIWRSRLV